MSYPASLDDFTPRVDDVDDVMAADVNELQTAIEAIETELGTDPAGTATDLKTRLANAISDGGFLKLKTSTELTISSGAITVTQNFHTIDTEGDAASDDLATISGGAAGLTVFFRIESSSRNVVIKHNTGNILSTSGADIILDTTNELLIGIYDGGLSKWLVGILSAGSSALTFLGLSDTPSAFTSQAGKFARVNSGETALEFAAVGAYRDSQGRITLETDVAISTSDQEDKDTLYFTPYRGNTIGLFNGTSWDVLTFAELSLDISGYTADKNYDIWAYNNGGSVALDSTVWTNDATRATALAMQDGIYCKTGALTRRYLGTIRIDTAGGTCTDSLGNRGVWNYYNQVKRELYFANDTDTHTYSTATWRAWNNDAANKLCFVIGVSESTVTIHTTWYVYGDNAPHFAIGYNVTNAPSGSVISLANYAATGIEIKLAASGEHMPAEGWNYYAPVEFSGTDENTFDSVWISAAMMG